MASTRLPLEKFGLLPGQIYGPFGDPSGQQRHTPVKAERAQVLPSETLSISKSTSICMYVCISISISICLSMYAKEPYYTEQQKTALPCACLFIRLIHYAPSYTSFLFLLLHLVSPERRAALCLSVSPSPSPPLSPPVTTGPAANARREGTKKNESPLY